MGTKLLLGFGGTVIQVVVHLRAWKTLAVVSFGGTVIQVVVHRTNLNQLMYFGFGGTVNQAVVHQGTHEKILCRGFGKYRNSSGSSPRHLCRQDRNRFRMYRKPSSSSPREGSTFKNTICFGSTVNQTVVHRLLAAKAKELVSEVR